MHDSIARSVRFALLLAAVPLALPAQQAGNDSTVLEEIVVTAQKRAESLRDVPLSVNAVSGDKLAEAGIVRMDDLKAYVPNLQMTETGIANNIYIRGIGSGLNQGFEQSVSVYSDGIYRGRGTQSRLPFFDLARIEVLRGPQPVLFGKNAVAGAVNLVSNQPGSEFEALLRLSDDFETHDRIATAVMSGPLSETFGARGALYYRNADGYVRNLTLDRSEPQRRDMGGRVTLTWTPSDALKAALRIESGRYQTRGRQIEIFGETPITAGPLTGLRYSQIIAGPLPAFPQGQDASAANNVIDYRRSSNGDSSEITNAEVALTVDYTFANDLTLTSVTGYSQYQLDELCDCDFVGATIFNAGIMEDYHQFSQELRLASPSSQRLSWITGLFFQDYALDESDYLYVPPNSLVVPVLTSAFQQQGICNSLATCAGLAGAFRNAANPRAFTQNSRLWSAFAQLTLRLTDSLRLTAGGRYSNEDKDGTRVTRLTSGLGGPDLPAQVRPLFAQVLGIVPHSLAGSRSENNFSPLVNLQYNFAGDALLYLSWSQGYKAGGFDARSNKPPVPGGTPLTSGSFMFEDEKATTYELGLKTAVGRSAELSAAVFYTDYKDLQTTAFDGAIGFNVGNGSAEVRGVELEGRWRPAPRLLLSGSLAYLDFEWTDYFGQCYYGRAPLASGPNAGNCDYAGYGNQLAPKVTGVLSASYSWPLGGSLMLSATTDVLYSSKFLQSLTLDPVTTQDAFYKLNARLALGPAAGGWEVALVGRNLTDETTVSYAGDTPLASRLFGARSYYGFTDPPRGIALEGTLRF
ncbi:MAG: TonB-dependent receptor [Steroidobacteraceae bacterium]